MTASPAPQEPRQRNLPLWRGDDNPTFVWPLAATRASGLPEGADFVLMVQWGARGGPANEQGQLTRTASGMTLVVDRSALTVAWVPAVQDLAVIPRGAAIRYELKYVASGKTHTLFWGDIRLGSGLLRDPVEDSSPAGTGYTDLRLAAFRSEVFDLLSEHGVGNNRALIIEQAVPAAVWTLDHNLDRFPDVVLVDSSGDKFDADIRYSSSNTIIVSLTAAASGTAYLN